jgi:hypothetical protein
MTGVRGPVGPRGPRGFPQRYSYTLAYIAVIVTALLIMRILGVGA